MLIPHLKKSDLTFSGHESFYCRQFWLKKGYDFVLAGNNFSAPDAVVELGVGKNMVTSILYWLKSFNLLDEKQNLTKFAHFLFSDHGVDPYLEDIGTLWLLHYHLVTRGKASIFSLVFNVFRRERYDWTHDQLVSFLEQVCRGANYSISPNTLRKDVDVFIRTYLRPEHGSRNIEDDFSSLLIDLELLSETKLSKAMGGRRFSIESTDRSDIPWELILYAILDQYDGNSFAFQRLLNDPNSPGTIFTMTEQGLAKKIKAIVSYIPDATFATDAGIRELQFEKRPNPQAIMMQYYEH